MKRALIFSFVLALTFAPTEIGAITLQSESFNPHLLLTDEDFTNSNGMSKTELKSFLARGSLGTLVTADERGVKRSAEDIIWDASKKFSLNPRFLLALLQREQSLVEDPSPTSEQLDWAMGYAICDDCSKSDPRLQKFRGFGNQVHYAAERIRANYINDLTIRGFTESGIGPGITTLIDGMPITPANIASAVLYTYTPHLHGNQNFVKIWNRWFENTYPSGSLLQDKNSGGIWLIQNGARRPIASRAAFYSRFNPEMVIQVSPETFDAYPVGDAIRFPNYSLLRSPRGTVYLLVNDTRRGFTSQEAFRAIGYSPDEIIDVDWSDLLAYKEGEPITTHSVYPQGALIQDNSTGGVYFVKDGLKHPIMSREILKTQFASKAIVAVSTKDLLSYERAEPILFPDGTLVSAVGSPDVFVIENGQRHHIKDEATFLSFKWKWTQIVNTDEKSVLIHPLGEPVSTILDTTETSIAKL